MYELTTFVQSNNLQLFRLANYAKQITVLHFYWNCIIAKRESSAVNDCELSLTTFFNSN